MRKSYILFVSALVLALAGCASTAPTASNLQAAIATACPVVQVSVADVQSLGISLGSAVQADLAKVSPVLDTVCASNGAVDTTSLSALVKTSLPALIADINATALPADIKTKAATAIAVAQIALTAALQMAPVAAVPATAAPTTVPVAPAQPAAPAAAT